MFTDWQKVSDEIRSTDPTITIEVVFDANCREAVIYSRDTTRYATKAWLGHKLPLSCSPAQSILNYWAGRRKAHPESYLTCSCHAHQYASIRNLISVKDTRSAICPCGIDRRDCDYHK